MRLTTRTETRQGWGELDAFSHLDPASRAPIAVAVSGGGDSLAALIHTCAWAERAGRPVLALSVDHRLQPASAEWTAFAGACAARLGARFHALAWTGDKPTSGLAAAARAARHRLIAQAAAAAGCTVMVTGHTAGDAAENAVLGQGRLTAWAPSPVWPEGRGLFLLRPLLDQSRAAIRADLTLAGWTWIDDPANDDTRHPRVRARQALTSEGGRPSSQSFARSALDPAAFVSDAAAGVLRLPRSASPRQIAMAAVSVGGGEGLPRGHALERLIARLGEGEPFATTLAGARIAAAADLVFTREVSREGLPRLLLPVGEPVVWDGRYEALATRPGYALQPLAGLKAKLQAEQQAPLRRIVAAARPTLPAVTSSDGAVVCPILAGHAAVRVKPLIEGRFLSACGAISCEAEARAFARMAKLSPTSYVGSLGLEGEIE